MSGQMNADQLCDAIRNRVYALANRVSEELETETSKAMDEASMEFGQYQQSKITELFNNAVSYFYNQYEPVFYKRQGDPNTLSGGLYDVLSLKVDEFGQVEYDSPFDLIDEDRMHKDREGNSLFQKVFMQGWHGGAESIAESKVGTWGAHPNPGVPYYRTPHPKYARWGERAKQSVSPWTTFNTSVRDAESGIILQRFKEISQRHNDDAVQKVVQMIPQIREEIDV